MNLGGAGMEHRFASWRSLRGVVAIVACAAALLGVAPASVAASDPATKLSAELQDIVSGTGVLDVPWLKQIDSAQLVRVIVMSTPGDPSLTSLRQFLVAIGGAVYYRYTSIPAVAAMVPVSRLLDLA